MELRHLETLIAIEEEGTFTAAADLMRTVQSNVSEQVRQLEAELGVTLLARGRSGATPTESGEVVLNHARRIRRELELLRGGRRRAPGPPGRERQLRHRRDREPLARPQLVADLRRAAPRGSSCASTKVRPSDCSPRCRTRSSRRPSSPNRFATSAWRWSSCSTKGSSAWRRRAASFRRIRCRSSAWPSMPLVLPPAGNPLRIEIEQAARAMGVTLQVSRRGRGHPAHRRPRGRGRRGVHPARDRHPARARLGLDLCDRGPSTAAARTHLAEGGTAVARGSRRARDRPQDRGQRPLSSPAGRPHRQRP